MSQVIDSLDDARAAASRQAWRSAYAAYAEVDPQVLTAADLESYGEAAWWSGKLEEAIAHRERAYAAYTADGDALGAARMALWRVSWDHNGRGSFAIAGGWFANAQRLLEGLPEAPEHARLALVQALTALFGGELDEAVQLFDGVYEVGHVSAIATSDARALRQRARRTSEAGEIDKGLALLDEATASAMCGDLRAHSAGLVYCITISSCQDVGDYRRAAEWTEVANRWCDKLDLSGFPGACRIHRAEALRLRGDWPAAEAQALEACEELHDFDHYHRRRADATRSGRSAAGAETSPERRRRSASRTRWAAILSPASSLLRLGEGKIDAAAAGIARSLLDTARTALASSSSPRTGRDRDRLGRSQDGPGGRGRGRRDRRLVQDRKPTSGRVRRDRCTSRVARFSSPRSDWDAAVRSLQRARGRVAEGGRAVRDRASADAPGHRLRAKR